MQAFIGCCCCCCCCCFFSCFKLYTKVKADQNASFRLSARFWYLVTHSYHHVDIRPHTPPPFPGLRPCFCNRLEISRGREDIIIVRINTQYHYIIIIIIIFNDRCLVSHSAPAFSNTWKTNRCIVLALFGVTVQALRNVRLPLSSGQKTAQVWVLSDTAWILHTRKIITHSIDNCLRW